MSFRVDVVEGGRIALNSLRTNRSRTVLTTLGIGIGVCTLLAIVGIIQGLNKSFADQLATMGANTMHVSKFPWVMRGNWWEFRNRRDLTVQHAEAIRSQSKYVDAVAPMTQRRSDVSFLGQQLSSVGIVGSTSEYPQIGNWEIVAGRFLTDADDENQKSVAVIGGDVADGLFPNMDPIGHSVLVDSRPFRVVGVLGRKGKILGESQDLTVIVPLKTFLGYFGKKRPLSIGVAIKDVAQVLDAQEEITAIMRRARGIAPEKDEDFTINRPDQLANTFAELTGALFGVAIGVGLITLLVGGIGIMNIMLVSVRERTREIGIRRALGAKRRTIITQFLMEAAAVSAIGGAFGTAAGLGLAKTVSEITPLAATVQPLTIVLGVGFAAVAGLLFGIWPAARAANLDPVEALRHE